MNGQQLSLSSKRNTFVFCGFLAINLACVSISMNSAHAENFERGQELYNHHCQSCHEDLLHAKNPRVRTLGDLRKRIESWATHTGTGWTSEEINDVLYYLNKTFYRFDHKAL